MTTTLLLILITLGILAVIGIFYVVFLLVQGLAIFFIAYLAMLIYLFFHNQLLFWLLLGSGLALIFWSAIEPEKEN